MADKEIIIDGVDVSKCSHYNPLGNYNCGGTKKCSQWSNCHFKQLARKTQEYEELKAYAQRQENQREEYYKEYLKLSQECEKLKEKFKKFFNIDNQDCWDVAFLKDENARYTKALERIEYEATEEMKTLEADTDTYGCFMEILNIINKAKRKAINE